MHWNNVLIILLSLVSFVQLPILAQEPILVYPLEPLPGQTEEVYIAEVLAGDGVEITNVVRTCDDDAIGVFRSHPNNTPIANFGLDEGILMSTGMISNIPGPSTGIISGNMGTPGDASLDNISAASTFDACALEFDITPLGNQLSFYYVFGSEEYDNYVCSFFNDVFAFFISGPNPLGGSYNQENIALIPDTNIPVSISTVNDGVSDSGGGPVCILDYDDYYNDVIPELEFEGFTDTLKAMIQVVPGASYQLKMGIADGGDSALDSGVFIQQGSFTSTGIENNPLGLIDISLSGGYELESGDGVIIEECIGKVLSIEIDSSEYSELHLTYSGTAENGVDYYYLNNGVPTALPEVIPFSNGELLTEFEILGIQDEDFEPIETIIIELTLDTSSSEVLFSDTIEIYNNVLPFAQATANNFGPICPGTQVQLDVYGAEQYEWFPAEYLDNPNSNEPIATITENIIFGVALTNGPCTDTLYLDEITLFNSPAPTVVSEYFVFDNTPIMFFAVGATIYQWANADGSNAIDLSCTDCPNPIYTPIGEDDSFVLTSFDASGCFYGTDTVQVFYGLTETMIQDLTDAFSVSASNSDTLVNGYLMEFDVSDSLLAATSVQWDFGDGNTSDEFEGLHQYEMPGEYMVVLIILYNGVEYTFNKTITVGDALGINDLVYDKINIYPIPSKDYLNVDLNLANNIKGYAIHSVSGKKIKENILLDNSDNFLINLTDLQPGVYFLSLKFDDEIITKKFIVE